MLINTTDQIIHDAVEEAIDNLAITLSNITVSNTFTKCVNLAMAMVCHSVYPLCDTRGTLVPRKICSRSCDMFSEGGACDGVLNRTEYADAFDRMLSNCDTRVNPGGESPECISVPLEQDDPTGKRACVCVCVGAILLP